MIVDPHGDRIFYYYSRKNTDLATDPATDPATDTDHGRTARQVWGTLSQSVSQSV